MFMRNLTDQESLPINMRDDCAQGLCSYVQETSAFCNVNDEILKGKHRET